jgi:hypothetical protein
MGAESFSETSETTTLCSYATTARWTLIQGLFLANGSLNTFPLLGSRFLIMQQLDHNSGRAVFPTWSVPRGYKRDEVWSLVHLRVSSVRESVKRGLEPEAELEPLPENV